MSTSFPSGGVGARLDPDAMWEGVEPLGVALGKEGGAPMGSGGFGARMDPDAMWQAFEQLRSTFEKKVGSRMGRGDVRAAVLSLLAEKPMHGYQIIREIEERSGGSWKPSAGSVYPTLQLLAD